MRPRQNGLHFFQTADSHVFSWKKLALFSLKYYWKLFPRVQVQYLSISLYTGLLSNRWQTIIWTNNCPIYICICVTWPSELNKLRQGEVKRSATQWFQCSSLVFLFMVMTFYTVMPTVCRESDISLHHIWFWYHGDGWVLRMSHRLSKLKSNVKLEVDWLCHLKDIW